MHNCAVRFERSELQPCGCWQTDRTQTWRRPQSSHPRSPIPSPSAQQCPWQLCHIGNWHRCRGHFIQGRGEKGHFSTPEPVVRSEKQKQVASSASAEFSSPGSYCSLLRHTMDRTLSSSPTPRQFATGRGTAMELSAGGSAESGRSSGRPQQLAVVGNDPQTLLRRTW